MHLNVEIKAYCPDVNFCRNWLQTQRAYFKGLDKQIDTYFLAKEGRLKLRQGNIENSLIHYSRSNEEGPKDSFVTMVQLENVSELYSVLCKALTILVEVKKNREIYFIENVKFHLDNVPELGNFIEIEAIDTDGSFTKEKLLEQCRFFMNKLNIAETDLLAKSYSDMLMNKI